MVNFFAMITALYTVVNNGQQLPVASARQSNLFYEVHVIYILLKSKMTMHTQHNGKRQHAVTELD